MQKKIFSEILPLLMFLIIIVPSNYFCLSKVKSKSAGGIETKAEFLLSTGNTFRNKNLDSLIHYDSIALKESSVVMNSALRAKILTDIAWNSYLLGNNKASLSLSFTAFSLYSSLNDKNGMARCLNNTGLIYQTLGQYEDALNSHLKALEYYETQNNYFGLVKTYNDLGNLYKNMRDFKKSRNYYQSALQILDKNPNDLLRASTYNNFGDMCFEKGDLKTSLKYTERSLKIKKGINQGPNETAKSYQSMGNLLRVQKRFKSAEKQYKTGLSIARRIGNKSLQALFMKNMAELYEQMNRDNTALKFYGKSLAIAEEINYLRVIKDNLIGFSGIYQKLGNYKLAYKYFQRYRNRKDSAYNAALKTKLDKYRNQYEAVRKAQAFQKLKASKEKSVSAWMTAALLLIVLLLIVIFIRYRTKNKLNTELVEKNTEVADLLDKLNKLNKNLSDSESTYRYLFDQNPVAMFILEQETFRILAVNGSATKQYGFSEREFLKMTFDCLWNGENIESFYDFQSCILSSPGKTTSGMHIAKDGRTIFVEIAGRPLIIEGKKTYYVMASDETERGLIEQIVHESEERFRNLFEGSPDAIILVDTETESIMDANPAASDLFKRSKSEILMLKYSDLYPKDMVKKAKDIISELPEEGSVEKTNAVELEIEIPGIIRVPVEISCKRTKISGRPVTQCIFREISIRKITEAALIQSEHRLSKAQTIANVGNWEVDLKTGMVVGSEESSLIYGLDKNLKTIPFSEIQALAQSEYRDYLDAAMNALINEGREFDVKFKIRKKNTGEIRVLESRAELILDEHNRPEKVLGAIRDITELTDYQEQLILARKKAEKSDMLKSEFLAQMSHEIRSPVNTIMSYASLIKDELNVEVNEEISSCFSAIDSGGRRLIRTIDLILNMADIQSGKYEPTMEYTDLAKDLLEKIADEYIPAANEKELKLRFINDSSKGKIFIDRYTVSQIFSNLIDNAVKYTHRGEVEIRIENSEDYTKVIVKDTGIGISKEYLPHIFDPFSQEDHGYTRRFEGTGLGLSLVKQYCNLNRAIIYVDSKKGTGTAFTIKFMREIQKLS